MKRLCLSLLLAMGAAGGPALAADEAGGGHDPLLGRWLTSKGSIIEMYHCPGGKPGTVCGRLAYSVNSRLPDGSLRPNVLDPSKPLCGAQIVTNLRREGADMWTGGSIADPEKGSRASIRVRMVGPNEVEARFFKGISLIGMTEKLTRATHPTPPC